MSLEHTACSVYKMREALWSSTGIVFNGAETNCRIAHVLDILLMVSY